MPTIFAGYPAEKIGCRQFIYSLLAQLVERSAVKQIERFTLEIKVSSSIRKLIDEKVAKSVKLLTGNAEDNTEQGESYV